MATPEVANFEQDKRGENERLKAKGLRLLDKRDAMISARLREGDPEIIELDEKRAALIAAGKKEDGTEIIELDEKRAALIASGKEAPDQAIIDLDAEFIEAFERWKKTPGIKVRNPKGFERAIKSYARELKRKDKKSGETASGLEAGYMSGYEAVGETGTERRAVLSLDLNEYFIETTHVTDVVEDLIHNTPPLAPSHLIDDTDKDLQRRAIAVVFRRFPEQMKGLYRDLALPKESHNYEKAMATLERMKDMLQEQYKFLSEVKGLREEVETEQLIEGAESKFKNMAKEVVDNPGKSLLLAGGLILSLTALYQLKYGKKIIKFLGFSAAGAAGLTAGAFGLDWVVKAASDDNTGLFDRLGFNPATFSESAALARFEHLFDEMDGLNNQAALDLIRLGNEPIENVLNKFNSALSSGKKSINPLAFNLDTERESDMNEESIYNAIRGVVLEGAERAGKKGDEYAGIKYLRERFGKDFTVFNVLMHMNNKGGTLGELNPDGSLASNPAGVYGLPSGSPKERARATDIRTIFRSFAALDETDVSPAGDGLMIVNGYPLEYTYEYDERQRRGIHVLTDTVADKTGKKRTFNLTVDGTSQAVAAAIVETIETRMQERFLADEDLRKGMPSDSEIEYNIEYNHKNHQWELTPSWEIEPHAKIKNSYRGDGDRYVNISFYADPKFKGIFIMYKGKEGRYNSFDEVREAVEEESIRRKLEGDMGHLIGNLGYEIKDISKDGLITITYGKPKTTGTITYEDGNVKAFDLDPSEAFEEQWEAMANVQTQALLNHKDTLATIARLSSPFQGASNNPGLTSWQGFKERGLQILNRATGSAPYNMSHEQMWWDQVLHHMDELELEVKHSFYDKMEAGLVSPGTTDSPGYTQIDFRADSQRSGGGIGGLFTKKLQKLDGVARAISSSGTTVGGLDYVRLTQTKDLRERNWHNPDYTAFMNYVDTYLGGHDAIGQKNLSTSRAIENSVRLMIYDKAWPIPQGGFTEDKDVKAAKEWMSWVNHILPNVLDTAEMDDEGNFFFGTDRRYNHASVESAFEAAGLVSFQEFKKAPDRYYTGGVMAFAAAPTPAIPGADVTPPSLPGLPDLPAWLTFNEAATDMPVGKETFNKWFESEISTFKRWNTALTVMGWEDPYERSVDSRVLVIEAAYPGDPVELDKAYRTLAPMIAAEMAVFDRLQFRGVKASVLGTSGSFANVEKKVMDDVIDRIYKKHSPLHNDSGVLTHGAPTAPQIVAYQDELLKNLEDLMLSEEVDEDAETKDFLKEFDKINNLVDIPNAIINPLDSMRWQSVFNSSMQGRLAQVKAKSSNSVQLKINLESFLLILAKEKELVWSQLVQSGVGPGDGALAYMFGSHVETEVITPINLVFQNHFLNTVPTGLPISSEQISTYVKRLTYHIEL